MLTPRLLLLLDLQTVPAGPPVGGTLHKLMDFMAIDQGDTNPNWCWAAVAAMVFQHYSGRSLEPCEWATICIGTRPNQCCLQPGSCDRSFPIVGALRGMLGDTADSALDPAQIAAEIGAQPMGRPIVCIEKAAAHVVVIHGIDEQASGQTFVYFVDPAGGYFQYIEIQQFTDVDPGWSGTVLTQPGGP